jgi:hypothetical protein
MGEHPAETKSQRPDLLQPVGSSTKSSNVGVSQPDMTNSQPTIWRSSSSHQSEFGCVLTSPRPNRIRRDRNLARAQLFRQGASVA